MFWPAQRPFLFRYSAKLQSPLGIPIILRWASRFLGRVVLDLRLRSAPCPSALYLHVGERYLPFRASLRLVSLPYILI